MFEWFDPSNWGITYEEYYYWWNFMLNTAFKGIYAKIIASLALLLSVYSVIRKKFKPFFSLFLFFVAVFFTYAGAVVNLIL